MASLKKPKFDCYTGEFIREVHTPRDRYIACVSFNFGDCSIFEPKQEGSERPPN